MQMHSPAHPGEVIRGSCFEPLGIRVTAAAAGLGVTRKALSDLLNGHSGVSPKWRSGWKRRAGAQPTHGFECRLRRAYGKRDSMPTRSRFVDFLNHTPLD
jgi:hypothetical protein